MNILSSMLMRDSLRIRRSQETFRSNPSLWQEQVLTDDINEITPAKELMDPELMTSWQPTRKLAGGQSILGR